jgi:peptide/nickel transport system permease protein
VRFLARRLLLYLVTAWAAVSLTFVIPRLMPGSPIDAALARLQGQLSPAATQSLAAAFGIKAHGSLLGQYVTYWWQLLHGNLGVSFTYFPTPVTSVLAAALPWTIALVTVATVLAWVLGTAAGAVLGAKRGSALDAVIPASSFVRGIPQFFVGILLVQVFGISLHWFPASGGYAADLSPSLTGGFIGSAVYHAVLPALTIVIGSMAGHLLTMRNMMITTLAEDYVLAAEAEGLPRWRIVLSYGARNAILPSATAFALELGFVVSGVLFVEKVFSYPGVGYVLFEAIGNQDYPLMQAIFLVITLAVLAANAVADVALVVLDPRTKETARG